MYQTSLHQSPIKDGRRILSEKNTNACLSLARSPAKQMHPNAPSQLPKKLLPSPLFAPSLVTQKRPIAQVDAEETGSCPPVSSRAQRAEIDHGSDALNVDVCEQIRQQDPTSEEQGDPISPRTVPSDPETRKQFIQEKATLLRSRLQNAMRRVRDPQFDRRVSELEEHSRKYLRLSASATKPPGRAGLQQHLERKYGTDWVGTRVQAKEGVVDDAEPMLSTPRAQVQRKEQEQGDFIQIPDDDEKTTPTQNSIVQHIETHTNGEQNRAPSPTQMILSSPTYNSTAPAGRFDDDRPIAREAIFATSPSSPVGKEGRGDGDAVDGLLKLMGTPTAEQGHGQGQGRTGYGRV